MLRGLTFLLSGALFTAYAQQSCDALKSSLAFPDATVTAVESIPAGPAPAPAGRAPAAVPAGRGGAAPVSMLPAYCRVSITLKPSTDSDIKMEAWLPVENWNGKFQMAGNGGWAGSMQGIPVMQTAIKEGYATAGTDTGHTGSDPVFGLAHPEKLVDFAYRSMHETVVKSKAIITKYYGKPAKLSYWNGCSTGGRQGLMEAQKYPEDFDGIIAGAPADYQTHLHAWDMMVAVGVRKDADHFLTQPKLNALNKAVLAQCDAMDGVKDGLLNDPRKCHFDPNTLLCKAGDKDDCLTAPQIESVKLVYSSAKKNNGELIFPGKEPGGEAGWNMLLSSPTPPLISLGSFEYATYQDANWDWKKFDLDRDTTAADEKFGYVNAPPDLSAFKARGGKLLMYHGWNDPAISPENTVNFYTSMGQKTGSKEENWARLFMVPGMGHCQGGPGPDQFNKMAVIERWRESNTAPEQIIASHVTGNNIDMTRPLCPYPQVAVYKGVGSTNDAASF